MLDRLKRWLQASASGAPGAPETEPAVEAPAAPQPASLGSAGGIVIIDVRSEREFCAVAIDSAVNVPLSQLEHRIRELVADRTTPLVLGSTAGGAGTVEPRRAHRNRPGARAAH